MTLACQKFRGRAAGVLIQKAELVNLIARTFAADKEAVIELASEWTPSFAYGPWSVKVVNELDPYLKIPLLN